MTSRLGFLRRLAAALMVAVYALAMPMALTAGWIRGTVVSSSGYASAVAGLVEDPVVRGAVTDLVAAEVESVVSSALASAAPPRVGFLAGPLAARVAGPVGELVDEFMASQRFQRLWEEANAAVHRQIVKVLEGRSATIKTDGDDVVLDLVPLIAAALEHTVERLPDVAGLTLSLPDLDALPEGACRAIAGVTRTDLPPSCGQIPLFPASALADAQNAFWILRDGTLALVLLPPVAAVAALMAAPRRRTVLLIGAGGALTVLAALGAATWLQSTLVGQVPMRFQPLVAANVDALTADLHLHAQWCVAAGLLITLGTVVARPGRGGGRAGQRDVSDRSRARPLGGPLVRRALKE